MVATGLLLDAPHPCARREVPSVIGYRAKGLKDAQLSHLAAVNTPVKLLPLHRAPDPNEKDNDGLANPRNPRHFDRIEGGRNSVSDSEIHGAGKSASHFLRSTTTVTDKFMVSIPALSPAFNKTPFQGCWG